MLAFFLQFADLCERYAERRERPFSALLDEAWPGAATSWTTFEELTVQPPDAERVTHQE
jgi:hypothetical protein